MDIHIVIEDFITEEQRSNICQWITELKEEEWLIPFTNDPSRHSCKGVFLPMLHNSVWEVKHKIMDHFKLQPYEDDNPQTFTFFSYHTLGGAVHKHRHCPEDGFTEFRCNVMISKGLGGDPVIEGEVVDVYEKSLWAFDAGKDHWSTPVASDKPRIICSFGFIVPTSFYDTI